MKGGSFMANTEIFLRNIFGTTRPNIRPLVLALNITNDLLFEQHISMSDIKATKHIYPDVARLLHKSKRKIVEDSSGKSKAAIFRKWQPLSAYRLSRFPPWETSFWRIAMRKSFQQEV